jgi:hypothetical protein
VQNTASIGIGREIGAFRGFHPVERAFTSGELRCGPAILCIKAFSSGDPSQCASNLSQRIGQHRDILVPEDRDAVFIHDTPMTLASLLKGRSGVLQSLPG